MSVPPGGRCYILLHLLCFLLTWSALSVPAPLLQRRWNSLASKRILLCFWQRMTPSFLPSSECLSSPWTKLAAQHTYCFYKFYLASVFLCFICLMPLCSRCLNMFTLSRLELYVCKNVSGYLLLRYSSYVTNHMNGWCDHYHSGIVTPSFVCDEFYLFSHTDAQCHSAGTPPFWLVGDNASAPYVAECSVLCAYVHFFPPSV